MLKQTRRRKGYSREVIDHILTHEFHQVGGGIVTGNGVRYDYRSGRNADGVIVFHGGRKKGKAECFLLFLNQDRTATLQSLRQASDCALDPNGTGASMVHAAMNLARSRGAVRIGLMDDSKKSLPTGKVFRLSNVYFLTTGQTWYESLIPGLQPQEKVDKIAQWRQRALTNTWEDIAQRLSQTGAMAPRATQRLGPITLPVDISDIDVTKSGSAMAVLRRIKEAKTDFFADYEDDILMASGIGNMFGIGWEAPLS